MLDELAKGAGSFLSKVVTYADDFLSGDIFNPKPGGLNTFIAAVKKRGLAKTSHFMVTLNTPPSLFQKERKEALGNDNYPEMFALFCKGVNLPGISYATAPVRTYGEPIEVPYEKMHDLVTLRIYVDSNMMVKSFFDQWMDSIQLHSTKGFSFYDEYRTTIDIDVFNVEKDNSGNPVKVYSVRLIDAYPKMISSIEMDYESEGIMILDVMIQYRSWISASWETQKQGVKTVFDKLFGDNPIYKGVMGAYSWIGDVLTTADTYLDRFDRIKGGIENAKTTVKTIPGLIKNKSDRIKNLKDFL